MDGVNFVSVVAFLHALYRHDLAQLVRLRFALQITFVFFFTSSFFYPYLSAYLLVEHYRLALPCVNESKTQKRNEARDQVLTPVALSGARNKASFLPERQIVKQKAAHEDDHVPTIHNAQGIFLNFKTDLILLFFEFVRLMSSRRITIVTQQPMVIKIGALVFCVNVLALILLCSCWLAWSCVLSGCLFLVAEVLSVLAVGCDREHSDCSYP